MIIRPVVFEKDVDQILTLGSSAGSGIQLSPSDTRQEWRKKFEHDPTHSWWPKWMMGSSAVLGGLMAGEASYISWP
jgi:hypothetical protein